MAPIKVIVFDVNETLLDLAALDPHFARIFGDAEIRKAWFAQLMQLFLTATITGEYQQFQVLAGAALDMVAELRNVTVTGEDRRAIQETLLALPAHQDVLPALEELQSSGLRLAVLTNSTEKAARAQLTHAGLAPYFEAMLSADAVQRFKPAREAYAYAAATLRVEADEIRLVAAHGWDISGALAAGCRAAFVRRAGKVLSPLQERPDIVGTDVHDVARQIMVSDGSIARSHDPTGR